MGNSSKKSSTMRPSVRPVDSTPDAPAEAIADAPSAKSGFGRAQFIPDNKGPITDSYKVDKRKIGEGAYGAVYKAVNIATDSIRAIKSITKSQVKNPDQLFKEINIMKQLDHPNIIKLYETFQDHRNIYLVMELCDGGELFDRIVEVGNFTEGQAAILMEQIFMAIFYMHQQSMTHRDIKPENFIFGSKEPIEAATLKLLDFGLSCTFHPGQTLTTKAGTPYYVAPQVLQGNYNELADVWSCGVVMYVLLCGYPPFHGDTDSIVLKRVRAGHVEFPAEDWGRISPDAKDLIKKCLTMKVSDRYTAEQAVNHIWVTERAPTSTGLNITVVDKLKVFKGQNKLKKAALQVIAGQLNEKEILMLRESFKALDENKDGTLTLTELKTGLERSGLEEIPSDLKQLMEEVDGDGSGQIDYTEFLAATIDKQVYAREEVMWSAFRTFDLDGDGRITMAELRKVLEDGTMEAAVNAAYIADVMKEIDVNGDGEIDFKEFVEMMKR